MSDFTTVCLVADIPPRSTKRVALDGQTIALVNTDEGFFAVQDRCSHADVSLSEGEVDGCTIECWLHGSAFDLRNGLPLSLPAIEPIATYAVRIDGEGDAAVVQIDPTPNRVHSAGPPAYN